VNDIARILVLLCIVAVLVGEIFQSKLSIGYLLVLICYMGLTCLIGLTEQGINFIFNNIQLYILLFMAFLFSNHSDNSKLGTDKYRLDIIFTITLCIYPVWIINSLLSYASNLYLARALAGSNMVDEYYWSLKGVGGYGMIYSLVFYSLVLLYLLLTYKKNLKGIRLLLVIFNYLISVVTVINAGYSIALLALILGTMTLLLIRNNNVFNIIKIICITLAIVLVVDLFLDQILQYLVNITQSTLYETKVADIIYSFQSDNTSGTLNNRWIFYQGSLDNFKEHLLFGTSIHGYLDYGGHSFLLDILSMFGLFGGLSVCYLLFNFNIKCIKGNKAFSLSITLLITLLFICLTNKLVAAMGPVLYVIYPFIVNLEGGIYEKYHKNTN
jgi:hypothetical protein